MRKFTQTLAFLLALLVHFPAFSCDTPACSVAILPTNNQVIAVQNGAWNTAATWNTGVVPAAGKNVVIPAGISVTYNKNMSITGSSIRSVLIQGTLSFSTSVNTGMNVDTIVVDSTGTLNIGTSSTPINSAKVANIVFNGATINTSTDPQLKGIGGLFHGTVNIYGSPKTPYLKVAGTGNVTGSSITLESAPSGWVVGDKIVVTGSDFVGFPNQQTQLSLANYETHDEVRSITSISGNVVTLDSALGSLRSNSTPNKHARIHPEQPVYMANLTRNVRFFTLTANKDTIYRRGHIMFMTSPNVVVKNASFTNMGRTDKSYPVTAKFANGVVPGSNPVVTTTGSGTTATSNMRGRYSLHIHKVGSAATTPIVVEKNTFEDSPGWMMSLHSSYGHIANNVSFSSLASHFVAEDGDERGEFQGNLAIKSVGDTVDDCQVHVVGGPCVSNARGINKGYASYDPTYDVNGNITAITKIQDDGQLGNCYWFQSRNLAVEDNIAVSCSKNGFSWFHRNVNEVAVPTNEIRNSNRDIMAWHKKISNTLPVVFFRDEIPLTDINNNVAIASSLGLGVVKEEPNQSHNVINHIFGTRAFNVEKGVEFGYTGHYLVEDTQVFMQDKGMVSNDVGLGTNNHLENMMFKDFLISGWSYPADYTEEFPIGTLSPSAMSFVNGQVIPYGSSTSVDFDPARHIYEFDTFPRVNLYLPDVQKVQTLSTTTPTLTNVVIPTIPVATTGWWNQTWHVTGTLTDSGGVVPSSDAQSPYTVYSFKSEWNGNAIRARYLEQVGGVYVNRTTNSQGQPCILVHDHFSDRYTREVVPFDVCFPY